MLSKPLTRATLALWAVAGTLAVAAADDAVTTLKGEDGPPGDAPSLASYYDHDEVDTLVSEVGPFVSAAEAEATFVLPSELPDLSDAVASSALPELDAYVTNPELADGYVATGDLPDLAPYLSIGEAEALYLDKADVPATADLAHKDDLPDLGPYILADDFASETLTMAELSEQFTTTAAAKSAFVSKNGPLPAPLVAQVQALANEAIAAQTCPAGMVAVADFCIDKVEASVWDGGCEANGSGKGTQRGAVEDDYDPDLPDSGAFQKLLWSCPSVGVKPSRFITYFQAQQACAASGKRLCSDAEWQVAALGTNDAACVTAAGTPKATGSQPGCKSSAGTLDMAGNVREIVADLVQAGNHWKNTNGEQTTDWPDGYGDGQDVVRGVNGTTAEPQKAGLPAMIVRGGSFGDGSEAGPYALSAAASPTSSDAATGFRCCRSRR